MASTVETDPPLITVLPGDDVTTYIRPAKHLKLGTGLRFKHHELNNKQGEYTSNKDGTIVATRAGLLQQRHNSWFVRTNAKRYIPGVEDRVVGVIMDRAGSDNGGDVYRVHIQGPHPALLSSLQFEGATKRNKPYLVPGALVYARITSCHVDVDPVLSCQLGSRDEGIQRKDWMTNEGTYGELQGGTVRQISLELSRELLHPGNVVLQELSSLPFEVCIGVNGILWVHSERPEYTILVLNAIANSAVLTDEQTRGMVQNLVRTVQRQLADDD